VPDLSHENRLWVCENNESNYLANGYAVSPFDVPSIIKPAYLAEKSVAYNSKIDWMNINLGIAAEDGESSLLLNEVMDSIIDDTSDVRSGVNVLGIDLGHICHFCVMTVLPDQVKLIRHIERVPLNNFRQRYTEVMRYYRCRIAVSDYQPYTETILSMQNSDQRLFGAYYTTHKSANLFNTKIQEAVPEEGKLRLRQVNINMNLLLDTLMYSVRGKMLLHLKNELSKLWVDHILSMKRVRKFDNHDNLIWVWEKTNGEDHFAHSTGYAYVASEMIEVSQGAFGGTLPLLTTIRIKNQLQSSNTA
jgi:hypothetical protein